MIATIRAAVHAARRHRKTRRGWPLTAPARTIPRLAAIIDRALPTKES